MMCEGRLAINGDRGDGFGVWTSRRLILTTRRFIQASISRWAGSRGSPCSAMRRQRLLRSELTYHGCLRSEACEPWWCAFGDDRAPSAAGCKRLGGSGAAAPDGAWLQAWLRLAQSRRRPCITKLYLRIRRCVSCRGSSRYAEVAGFENQSFGSGSAKVVPGLQATPVKAFALPIAIISEACDGEAGSGKVMICQIS